MIVEKTVLKTRTYRPSTVSNSPSMHVSSSIKVRDVRIISDRNSRRSKGIAYVEFTDASAVPLVSNRGFKRNMLGYKLSLITYYSNHFIPFISSNLRLFTNTSITKYKKYGFCDALKIHPILSRFPGAQTDWSKITQCPNYRTRNSGGKEQTSSRSRETEETNRSNPYLRRITSLQHHRADDQSNF